jgi:hypothetical protein
VSTVDKGKDALNQLEAKNLIEQSNGKIFSAVFEKKNGEKRHMVCRKGVGQYVSGGSNPAKDRDHLVVVFDMEKMSELVQEYKDEHGELPPKPNKFKLGRRAYRNINLNTLETLKIDGQEYTVK